MRYGTFAAWLALALVPAPVLADAVGADIPIAGTGVTALVYGPGGTGTPDAYFASFGIAYDVVDGATWSTMTQSQFAAYDLLYVDGLCLTSPDWAQALKQSQDQWGPAVTGRIFLATGDADFHTPISAQHAMVVHNAVIWVGLLGTTASGGATGLVIFSGCLETGGITVFDDLGPALGAITSALNESESAVILASGHPLITTPNALTLSNFIWGMFCHGSIAAFPGDYLPIVACSDGNAGVIARDLPDPVFADGFEDLGGP